MHYAIELPIGEEFGLDFSTGSNSIGKDVYVRSMIRQNTGCGLLPVRHLLRAMIEE